MSRNIRRLAALLSVALFAISATPVLAAAPSNDDIGSAIAIGAIPYSNSQDTSEATTGPTDPDCDGAGPTVWYEFTAAVSGRLEANTFGSDYDTTLYVGTPDGAGGVNLIACNDDTSGIQSRVRFDADAGTSYLFMVGSFGGGPGGELFFNLDVAPPVVPIQVSVTLDASGSFDRLGNATIRGTASCMGAAFVELYTFARQSVGRVSTIQGDGYGFVECPATGIPWSIQIWPYNGKFAGGPSQVSLEWVACGDEECVGDYTEAVVRLRK